ncbi:MAG: hypothetical protein V7719_12490 [Psychroserpens sp.]
MTRSSSDEREIVADNTQPITLKVSTVLAYENKPVKVVVVPIDKYI